MTEHSYFAVKIEHADGAEFHAVDVAEAVNHELGNDQVHHADTSIRITAWRIEPAGFHHATFVASDDPTNGTTFGDPT